jgi:hypothetical protein
MTPGLSTPDDVLRHGLFVQLRASVWTGSVELETSDLGMRPDELAKLFQLGRKRLVPKEALDPIRQVKRRADYTLDHLSTQMPDGGRFVLTQTLPEVLGQLQAHKVEFNAAVETFLTGYPSWKEQMAPEWRQAAEVAWVKAGRPGDQLTFVEQFLARVESVYPPADRLRGRFDFMVYTYELNTSGVKAVHAAHVAAEEQRRREQDDAYRLEVQARLADALDKSMTQLHAQVAQTFERVLEHVKSGKPLRDGSVERLRSTIERYRKLNIFGTTTLDQAIAAFERQALATLDADLGVLSMNPDLRAVFQQGLESVLTAATASNDVSALTGRMRRQFDVGVEESEATATAGDAAAAAPPTAA